MSVGNWIKVKAVFDEAPLDWSLCADIFDRHGCPGTLEEENPPALSAYLAEVVGCEERLAALRKQLLEYGSAFVETELIPEENWAENWKQFFKTQIIGNVAVQPTWEIENLGDLRAVVRLDPGQAFGTGDHPTTRLCLELLQRHPLEGKFVADIGCGSGILAIAAAKLGAKAVFASDIDPQSVEIAKNNASTNGTEISFAVAAGFDAIDRNADLLVSNIISATLIRLAPQAKAKVKDKGRWIVSGIIDQNWPEVRQAIERAGFSLEEMKQEGDWIAARFRL